jgi:septal ring factor EnvC (AmiA/AmiB activator)
MSLSLLMRVGLLAAASFAFAGCQSTCTGDPRTDSLGCASASLRNGGYSRQTAMLANTAYSRRDMSRSAAANVDRVRARANDSRAQADALDRAAREQSDELDALRSELAGTEARLARLRDGGSPEEIARLEAEVASLRDQIARYSR